VEDTQPALRTDEVEHLQLEKLSDVPAESEQEGDLVESSRDAFSTCDEWLDSPGGAGRTSEQPTV